MKQFALVLSVLVFSSQLAFAKCDESNKAPLTKEERAKKAEMFEKAAACLKSDKPQEECLKELEHECGDCGHHGEGHGKHDHKHGMKKKK